MYIELYPSDKDFVANLGKLSDSCIHKHSPAYFIVVYHPWSGWDYRKSSSATVQAQAWNRGTDNPEDMIRVYDVKTGKCERGPLSEVMKVQVFWED
jgi:hypothetical protein